MVLGEVQQRRHPGPETSDRLELEAGDFHHAPVAGSPRGGDERRPEIPPDEHPGEGPGSHPPDEGGHRRLPVGSRDRRHLSLKPPEPELELPPYRDTCRGEGRKGQPLPGNAGRHDEQRAPPNLLFPGHPAQEGDPGGDRLAQRRLDVRAGAVVPQRDPGSLPGQQARREEPGPPGPRHDHLFLREGFHGHRIFSVLIASSARMIEMIQNRTMIFGSAHPCSSKWWWIGAIRKIRFLRVL